MRQNKRRKVLVHRRIQGALVRQLLLHWMVFVFVTALASIALQLLMDPLVSPPVRLYQMRLTAGVFLAVSVCFIPAFMYASVKLSHRIVGPVLRMHSVIRQLNGGQEVSSFQLRRGDFWHDLSEDFNELLGRVGEPSRVSDEAEQADAESEKVHALQSEA